MFTGFCYLTFVASLYEEFTALSPRNAVKNTRAAYKHNEKSTSVSCYLAAQYRGYCSKR
jgi:hypothetical protein